MALVPNDLPRDPEQLLQHLQQMTEVVVRQNASLVSLRAEHDTVLAERDAAQAEIEKLRLLIRQLQRGRFGRRSERLDPDQLRLGLEDLEQTAAAAEAAQEEVAARSGTPRPPRVRRRNLGALPAHLPRVEILVDVADKTCPCCRWTATAGSSACSRTGRPGRSGSRSAGRTADGAFTRSTRRPAHRWRKRPCAGSGNSTGSRRRSAAAPPRSGGRPGRSAASRSWTPCTPGSAPSWGGSRASPAWRRRSATRCGTGRGWCCSWRTAGSSWTTTPSSGRSGRSPWGARIACSPARMVEPATGRSWP